MATVALSGIITPTNVVTATSTTTLTNKTLTGAVMNGTLGATTPSTGAFTTVATTGNVGVGGTASTRLHVMNAGTLTTRIENTSSAADVALELKQTTGTFTTAIDSSSIFYNDTAARQYLWYQNSAERMRINGSGNLQLQKNLSIGAATPTTSGAGITFPATQSASTDANTLDDYEEGEWTPVQGAGLTVVGTYSSSGRYVKIGRLVSISGRVSGSSTIATTAGTIMMTGLPFTVGELTSVGVMTNNAINTLGGIGAFSTTAYSTTTIGATSAIDFSLVYSV
jgi:hypothetical protein